MGKINATASASPKTFAAVKSPLDAGLDVLNDLHSAALYAQTHSHILRDVLGDIDTGPNNSEPGCEMQRAYASLTAIQSRLDEIEACVERADAAMRAMDGQRILRGSEVRHG